MFTTLKHIRNVIFAQFSVTFCYCGFLAGVNLQQHAEQVGF